VKKILWSGRALRSAAASGVVSEREYLFAFCSREEEKFTMPPRRERQSPDPEDREVRRRGRQVVKSRNGETDARSPSKT
jgi:hypothetical protein